MALGSKWELHNAEEATYTREQMEAAVRAAQESFKRTFGEQALKEAMRKEEQKKQKEREPE